MRDWEKEGVRGQNGQEHERLGEGEWAGDERLGERGRMGRGMRDWEREGMRGENVIHLRP